MRDRVISPVVQCHVHVNQLVSMRNVVFILTNDPMTMHGLGYMGTDVGMWNQGRWSVLL